MSDKLTRRQFLKLAATGATGAALTGCGPATRQVQRRPYSEMPEYTLLGESTFYATTCGECPAACGLIVRTLSGRAHKVEGNPAHPVNAGNTCARGQAGLQGLYNPDRYTGPLQARGEIKSAIDWEAGLKAVQDTLSGYAGGEVAFILGLFPDHISDLVSRLAEGMGGAAVYRYSGLGEFDGRVTLTDAAQRLFGTPKLPYFDMERAEVTFSFGANFTETWLSPVAYAYDYGQMRRGYPGQRGYLVQFEPRMSQTAANADEWFPIKPGSEALLAQALAVEVARLAGSSLPAALADVDLAAAAEASGLPVEEIQRLARIFREAQRKVAIPGGIAMGSSNGLAAAEAILQLNALVDNLGRDGGVFLMPDFPLYPDAKTRPSSMAEMQALVERLNAGQIKAVFIHHTNPAYNLPKSLGFAEALSKAERVISFASFPDETALLADYILPDHTPLERFGYQKVLTGANRLTVSGLQPVVSPLHDTRSSADVLLAAAQAAGGALAQAVPFADEVAFLQDAVAMLNDQGGQYSAPSKDAFWLLWLQNGGWWRANPNLVAPTNTLPLEAPLNTTPAGFSEGEFFLLPFPHPNLDDGSQANRPVLQETPDPTTTVMWNTWIEINPHTAEELGLHNDDVVAVESAYGKIEVPVYLYPAIRPDTVAIPLGQGHSAYGRYAQGRGANPLDLLGGQLNESGSLAFMSIKVKLTATGRTQHLARYESERGIYGNSHG